MARGSLRQRPSAGDRHKFLDFLPPLTATLYPFPNYVVINKKRRSLEVYACHQKAPRARLELATLRLTAGCSTIELPRICVLY
jgi:hypothetical protein